MISDGSKYRNTVCALTCWILQIAAEQLSPFRCHTFLETGESLADRTLGYNAPPPSHVAQVSCSSGESPGSFTCFCFRMMDISVLLETWVHVYVFLEKMCKWAWHRPSFVQLDDGLASTVAGIQAVFQTDSSHLQVKASNKPSICVCIEVNDWT